MTGQMPNTSPAVPAGRRLGGVTVGLLFVFLATLYPPLHAQMESPTGTAAVESGHSTDCDRIHNDLSCAACGTFRTLVGEGTPTVQSSTHLLAAYRPLAPLQTPRSPFAGPTLDRGPPSA